MIKKNFNELLRKFTEQGGAVSIADRLQTLLGALPEKFDMLRESYFAQTNAPNIDYIWNTIFDIDTSGVSH